MNLICDAKVSIVSRDFGDIITFQIRCPETGTCYYTKDIRNDIFQAFTTLRPIGPNGLFAASGYVDIKSAAIIITWLEENSLTDPKPLTIEGVETFDKLVALHNATHTFRLERNRRGDDLHNAVYDYIKQGPLSFDEFAMIVDYLSFDYGLTKTAMHQTMLHLAKGGVPEMEKIKAFCVKNGLWEEMEEIQKAQRATTKSWAGISSS